MRPSCRSLLSDGRYGADTRLRERDLGLVGGEAGNTNVVVSFEVQLEVAYFQSVSTTVFGESASKVGDRVDEFVRDV